MAKDSSFEGSIPAIYDSCLGPVLFAPYAADLAARLADLRAGRVLETAAGTGVVTRALLASLPEAVLVDATDLNQPMLDRAAGVLSSPRVTYRQADAQALPFSDETFDAVVCQFGVMFFPDRSRAFAEAQRVLKPGGRLVFSVWDRLDANEFTRVVVDAVASVFPDDPPMFMVRTPHAHYDTRPIEQELRDLGFEAVAVEKVARAGVARDPLTVATGICQGTPMRNEIEARDPARLAVATEVAARALADRFGPGPITGRLSALVVTARRLAAKEA